MSCMLQDSMLKTMVRNGVANYGRNTGTIGGLGLGFVDRLLELDVVPLNGFANSYTGAPFDRQHEIPAGCKLRHFVYVVPIVERDDGQKRLMVGRDGEDLDIAVFFRPFASSELTYVAMPEQAFMADGSEVQYAFRVCNYFEHRNGVLEIRDDLAFGMEFTSSLQARHPERGVMLVTNQQMFSFQLGEKGAKQAGFKMQYHLSSTTEHAQVCAEAQAVLHTQAFGRVELPPSQEERMAKALAAHFNDGQHLCYKSGGAGTTRGGARGGGGLAHAKLSAGETKFRNVSVSSAVPIAERASARLCFLIGDIARTPNQQAYSAQAVAVMSRAESQQRTLSTPEVPTDGYGESMRCLASMRARPSATGEAATQLAQASADLFAWPVASCKAALAVGLRAHADKDDEDGEAVQIFSQSDNQRAYKVHEGPLLRVRVTNMSLFDVNVKLRPVYFSLTEASDEDEIDVVELKPTDSWELPYPLQTQAGDGVDGWLLQDGAGNTVLRLVFVLSEASLSEFETARADARIFIDTLHNAMFLPPVVGLPQIGSEVDEPMLPGAPATGMDTVTLECCICLDAKPVAQMAVFVPCGHVKCCLACFGMQARADTAARRPSRCPTCRAHVNNAMKVFF